MEQLKAVQALFNTDNLSRPPQPFPRTVVPVMHHNGSFSYPHRPQLMMPPPPPSLFGGQPRSAGGGNADGVFLSPNALGFGGGQPMVFGGGGGVGRPFFDPQLVTAASRRPIVLQPQLPYGSYTPGENLEPHCGRGEKFI